MSYCERLKNTQNLSDTDHEYIKLCNNSTLHKIKSTIYSLEKIKDNVESGNILSVTTSTTHTHAPQQTIEFDYKFQFAFHENIFFSSLIGAVDNLSLLINRVYNDPIPNVRNCSFKQIGTCIENSIGTNQISIKIENILQSNFYQNTEPFRHCLLHRYHHADRMVLDFQAGEYEAKLYLPDNPQVFPHSYNLQREMISFCENSLQNFVISINELYEILENESRSNGQIPL